MMRLVGFAGLLAVLLTGCDTGQVAGVVDDLGKLRGAHAARGGVILDGGKGGDWQVTRCDAAQDGSLQLSVGSASPLLTVKRNAAPGVTLNVPGGTALTFSGNACSIHTDPKGDAEHLTVDCTGGGHELVAGVTTLRCGG